MQRLDIDIETLRHFEFEYLVWRSIGIPEEFAANLLATDRT